MTFREVSTIADSGEQVDGASLALSNEASSLQLAQVRDKTNAKPATDAAIPAQAGAPAVTDGGPLASLLDPKATGSPTRLFPEIMTADEKWQQPYRELTAIDGHALVDRHSGALRRANRALQNMPEDKAIEMEGLAKAYLRGTTTPEQDQTLAAEKEFFTDLSTLRETSANPNLRKAFELKASVQANVGESITLRNSKAEFLAGLPGYQVMTADQTSAKGNAVGLILESKELERYKMGGRR